MRLYLSSFRIGSRPDELLALLRGGRRAALILNADDYKTPEDRAASLLRELEELRSIGLEPQEVDLRGFFGRPDALRGHLVTVDLLYVRGGNVFVLRRALHQSGADRIIGDLLARDDVVYGGYSAGACVLGPTLRGIESAEDDPHLVPEGYQTEVIWASCPAPSLRTTKPPRRRGRSRQARALLRREPHPRHRLARRRGSRRGRRHVESRLELGLNPGCRPSRSP
jgi:dipeptidase E